MNHLIDKLYKVIIGSNHESRPATNAQLCDVFLNTSILRKMNLVTVLSYSIQDKYVSKLCQLVYEQYNIMFGVTIMLDKIFKLNISIINVS